MVNGILIHGSLGAWGYYCLILGAAYSRRPVYILGSIPALRNPLSYHAESK